MPKTPYYIVETGNWKVRVRVEDEGDYAYVEAGTRAMEAVFGRKELNDECEIVSLTTPGGKDYFDPDIQADEKIPLPMFSIVTGVCHESDMSTEKTRYMVFLTRELFENAGQAVNVELAKRAEALEPEKVKRFVELRNKALKKIRKKKG